MNKIVCYDSDGAVIDHFTQWDVGQKITITGATTSSAPDFHFCNPHSAVALVVPSSIVGESIIAEVPDTLLREALPLTVHMYYQVEECSAKTAYTFIIPVYPRQKPAGYAYEEARTDHSWVQAIVDDITEKVTDEIKDVAVGDQVAAAEGAAAEAKEHASTAQQYAENASSAASEAVNAALARYATTTYVDEAIDQLLRDVADLKYVPIEITSISNSVSNSVGTVEMGSTVDTLTISWTLNKEPVSQSLNGEAVDPSLRSLTLEGLSLTAETAYTVKATDERDASDSGTTRIYFYNGVYYGVLEDGAVLDSAAILGLKKELQSGKTLTFTADAGASQRIAYALPSALPSRYGTPNFNVGGFDGGFTKAATVEFTNASEYMESYDVWLSDNTGLGSTTVKVT